MIHTPMIHDLMEKIEKLDTLCNERLNARRHFEEQQMEKDQAIDLLSSRIVQLYTTYNTSHSDRSAKSRLPDTFLIANLLVEIDKEEGSVHVIRYPSLTSNGQAVIQKQ